MSHRDTLVERRAAKKAELDSILEAASTETRDLSTDETAAFDAKVAEIRKLDEQIDALEAVEARESKAAEVRAVAGEVSKTIAPAVVSNEPSTYRKGGPASYFKDLYEARVNADRGAVERLVRNDKELRAQSTTAGQSGEFAPPLWLVDKFVGLARPGRVMADLENPMPLPAGVATVNLPKVSGGTTAAVQATQNSNASNTDMTSTSVSSGITTIAGRQIVSLQLLEQSGTPFDEVILADLAADYAKQLDTQVINGSGASGQLLGLLNVGGVGSTTYTDASPAVAGAGKFYAKLASAIQSIETTRYLPPSAIIMHPRRWAWICASFDSNNRPLIVPTGAGFNVAGDQTAVLAQGRVGEMLGLPVYVDPNIPTNLGAGTNEDRVIVTRVEDLWLYESGVKAEAFTQPYADSLGVLFRLYAYSAHIPHRYAGATNVISGTGLVTPAF